MTSTKSLPISPSMSPKTGRAFGFTCRRRMSASTRYTPIGAALTRASNRAWLCAQRLAGLPPQPGHLQVGRHPGQQLPGAERLDQVVVGPGLHPLDPALLAGAGRQHDDRHVRACAGSARSSRSSPNPSSRGIITSVRTRSGGRSRAAASAASPSGTASTAVAARPAGGRRTAACRRCRRPPGRGAGRRPRSCAGRSAGTGKRLVVSRQLGTAVVPSPDRRGASAAPPRRRGWPPSPVEASGAALPDLVGRQVGRPQRHGDGERRALPDDALGGDGAAVQLDQLLHQRQPDAAAFVGAAPRVLDPVEPLEQPGHLLGGDARAGVPHPQFGAASPARRSVTAISPSKVNLKALESRLRTIFSHMSRSTKTGSASGGQSTVSRSPARSHGRAEDAGQLGGEGGEVGRLVRRPDPARLDAGEVQQRVDQPQQPQAVAVDDLELARGGRRQVGCGCGPAGPRPGRASSVSGVRNSWLTLEKNAVLARSSSASASARCRSSS